MFNYPKEFYLERHENTIHSASTITTILLEYLPRVRSVIDVGCGVGTWLSVLKERGVDKIMGLDGEWVDKDLLQIPRECFSEVDLNQLCNDKKQKYDLAISLEVAEHLPPEKAYEFICFLTNLSDRVLFSAAIPFQGGTNHINEQWQHYWAELFYKKNYIVNDFIRAKIWDDKNIPCWYRQNILVYSKGRAIKPPVKNKIKKIIPNILFNRCTETAMPLNIVHPDLYIHKSNIITTSSKRIV